VRCRRTGLLLLHPAGLGPVRWPPVRAPVLDAFGGCAAALMPVCRPWSGEHSSRPVVTGRLGLPGSRRCRRL